MSVFDYEPYCEAMEVLGLQYILRELDACHNRGDLVRITGNHFSEFRVERISVQNYRKLIEQGQASSHSLSAIETYTQIRTTLREAGIWSS